MRGLFNSFGYALKGMMTIFRTEQNIWIHLAASVVAIALGFILHISSGEWIAITIVIALVIAAELFNTAIEYLVDHISPEHHPKMGNVKDMAAGAVLIVAIAALITGLIIFIPKIFLYL